MKRLNKNSLKIAIVFLALIVVGYFIGWGNVFDRLRAYAENGESPYVFLGVMILGTPLGFPLSFCYLFAGAVFGIFKGWLLCLAGLVGSSVFGYFLGRFVVPRKFIFSLREKIGLEKHGACKGMFNVNFFARAFPGIPYWAQNVILGGIRSNFLLYLAVNFAVQGTIALAMNSLAGALARGGFEKYLIFVLLILVLSAFHISVNAFYKNKNGEKFSATIFLKNAFWNFRLILIFGIYFLMNFLLVILTLPLILIPSARVRGNCVSRVVKFFLSLLFLKIIPFFKCYKMRVDGREKTDFKEASIYVANHFSLIDSLVLLSLVPNAGIVIKNRYEKWPAIWWLVRFFDFISVGGNSAEALSSSLEKCEKVLKGNRNLIIFPEGSRSSSRRVGDFKKLAFRLSKKCGAKIVPVSIFYSGEFLSKRTFLPKEKCEAFVEFFEPLNADDFKSLEELSARAHRQISKNISFLSEKFKVR